MLGAGRLPVPGAGEGGAAVHTLASMVLPVPGGPKSSTPRVGLVSEPRAKSSGRCSGSITTSRSVFFTASSAPMLSKLTPTCAVQSLLSTRAEWCAGAGTPSQGASRIDWERVGRGGGRRRVNSPPPRG